MALISAQTVREQVAAMGEWSRTKVSGEVRRFTHRQPIVNAYVFETLEDEGRSATGFALQIALIIDAAYRGALGRHPPKVTAQAMDAAVAEATRGFEQLVGVEPELALRRMLFQRDMVEPELLVEVLRLMFEEVSADPDLEDAMGVLFLAIKTVALAYERINGMARRHVVKGSVGGTLEAQLGRRLPKIGRNEPCPCGSARPFKSCCGHMRAPSDHREHDASGAPHGLDHGRAERLFADCLGLVKMTLAFSRQILDEPDGHWWRQQDAQFVRRFRPGTPEGVPESLHLGYVLFDLLLPSQGKPIGELLAERQGPELIEPGPTLIRFLCESYPSFYQLVERCPQHGRKRLRELVTSREFVVSDVDDPAAESGEMGEVWFCRLLGPPDDAFTFSSPVTYPPAARDALECLTREFIARDLDGSPSPPLADALRRGMKRATPLLAELLLGSAGAGREGNGDCEPVPVASHAGTPSRRRDAVQQLPLFGHGGDLQAVLESLCVEPYRTWPDRPLPALEGKTPRVAARTKRGRKRVEALLDALDYLHAARSAGVPIVDVAWLRRELGLDP